jgi:hypothetical protein
MGLIRQGLFPTQVMVHHKVYIKEKALNNELVTRDIFMLPSNVRNLAKKKVNEFTQRSPSMLDCGFWKFLIWFFKMSKMSLWI